MRAEDAAKDVRRRLLNRPGDDDLHQYPDDYFHALTLAVAWMRRKIAAHAPGLLYETIGPIASTDAGLTYLLPDDHLGEIEIWTPPGPPRGRLLHSSDPEGHAYEGAYIQGRTITMLTKTRFSPGLYIRYIPATREIVERDYDIELPEFTDEAVKQYAAYLMAKKPGSLLDSQSFLDCANREFDGDPNSTSDDGIIGRLKRVSANQASSSAMGYARPWYRFL